MLSSDEVLKLDDVPARVDHGALARSVDPDLDDRAQLVAVGQDVVADGREGIPAGERGCPDDPDDTRVLDSVVRFVGQRVAAVVADSEGAAEEDQDGEQHPRDGLDALG